MSESVEKLPVVYLEGRKVNLCPIDEKNIPIVTRWINDPAVREFISQTFPKTERQEREWYEKIGSDDKNIVLGIETKDGKFIGIMGVHRIDWIHRTCSTGALIGEKEYWGKGYGTDAKMHLLDHIFNTLNLNRVSSSVIEYNKRSLNYSLHCGYKVEGKKRQHIFKKGRYWDLIELGVLRKEWKPIWKKYKKTGKVR